MNNAQLLVTESRNLSTKSCKGTKNDKWADYKMIEICLVLHDMEKVTKTDGIVSDLHWYIKNLKQLMMRKIGSGQGADVDVESLYNRLLPQVETHLEPMVEIFNPLTQREKSYIVFKNDTEIGLPKLTND